MRVIRYADAIMNRIEEPEWRIRALGHSHAVAALAALLARRRGLDADVAAVCGILHDLAAYERRSYEAHAAYGAQRALEVLRELGETEASVLECVRSAILRHDDLRETDGPMDEVLKDADLLDNAQLKAPQELKAWEAERLRRVYEELGMPEGQGF